MRILAVITARGRSTRVSSKNVRILGGRPLVVWSIDVTRDTTDICDTLVSTDDPIVAEIARDGGALVPWLRPSELASDTASSVDVCLHALNWYETETGRVDGLLLLQPTSPFRSRETVLRGIELFRVHKRCVIAVSRATSHPMWCFRVEGETMQPFVDATGLLLRSQELPAAYVINGALYLITPEDLRTRRSFYGEDAVPLVIESPEEGVDIDTEWDWAIAETVAARKGLGAR